MPESEVKNRSGLREAIIRVIAFFDLFDYPLTALEISAHLGGTYLLSEIQAGLDTGDVWEQEEGFYFLPGRREIITTRQSRYNYSARKMKIARRFARAFRLLPGVRAVALANSIGFYNMRDGSDIDFFIITAPGRIWLSRLYCTGLAKLLNSRPTAANKKDKICLSFYISSDCRDLKSLRLPGPDPYFDYWLSGLVLLYNKENTYQHFLAGNGLNEARAGAEAPVIVRSLGLLERIAKIIQLKIMPSSLRAAMNNSDGVVVNDQVLKFYQSDRRREILEKYEKKIHNLLA
jgi:hypothetical protein